MTAFEHIIGDVYRLKVPFPGCWTGVVLVLGEANVLIDSGGCTDEVDACIVPALAAMGISLEEMDWLLLTHMHGDHVGGAARLKALAPRMRVGTYAPSAQRLADPLTYSRQIRRRFPEHSPAPPAGLCGVQADVLLKDGEFAGPVQLVHAPGHDSDSVCFWEPRARALITGDSLQLSGTCVQGCALLMDVPAYDGTLERLASLAPDAIICGHPYLPLGAEAVGREACAAYLAGCNACHQRDRAFAHSMVAQGESDPVAIARALIRFVGGEEPEHLFLPLYTVEGYITRQ